MAIWINLLIGLAMMIIGYIIMPKPKVAKPEANTDFDGPTAEAGRPITVVFGDIEIKSANYLWWGDKAVVRRTERKKGKK